MDSESTSVAGSAGLKTDVCPGPELNKIKSHSILLLSHYSIDNSHVFY